jgi:hypothetical protein
LGAEDIRAGISPARRLFRNFDFYQTPQPEHSLVSWPKRAEREQNSIIPMGFPFPAHLKTERQLQVHMQ